jgi:hypothetical protein
MRAASAFSTFRSCLVRRLAPSGFARSGDIFWRKIRDTIVVIEIQRSLKHSSRTEAVFTVNLGISLNALREGATDPGIQVPEVPAPDKCHWRQRLGYLMPLHADAWWTISNELTAVTVCDEITAHIVNLAVPAFEQYASSTALLEMWREGKGVGLTEYQRLLSLATLLVQQGSKDEAQAAIEALRSASRGKAWEGGAAHEAEELRKRLA